MDVQLGLSPRRRLLADISHRIAEVRDDVTSLEREMEWLLAPDRPQGDLGADLLRSRLLADGLAAKRAQIGELGERAHAIETDIAAHPSGVFPVITEPLNGSMGVAPGASSDRPATSVPLGPSARRLLLAKLTGHMAEVRDDVTSLERELEWLSAPERGRAPSSADQLRNRLIRDGLANKRARLGQLTQRARAIETDIAEHPSGAFSIVSEPPKEPPGPIKQPADSQTAPPSPPQRVELTAPSDAPAQPLTQATGPVEPLPRPRPYPPASPSPESGEPRSSGPMEGAGRIASASSGTELRSQHGAGLGRGIALLVGAGLALTVVIIMVLELITR